MPTILLRPVANLTPSDCLCSSLFSSNLHTPPRIFNCEQGNSPLTTAFGSPAVSLRSSHALVGALKVTYIPPLLSKANDFALCHLIGYSSTIITSGFPLGIRLFGSSFCL